MQQAVCAQMIGGGGRTLAYQLGVCERVNADGGIWLRMQ